MSTTTSLVTTPSRQLYQQQSGTPQSITPSRPSSAASPYKATVAPTPAPAPTPSPGTFRHPRLDEIISRQNKTTFSESNIRSAVLNSSIILLTFIFGGSIQSTSSTLINLTGLPPSTTAEATSWILILLRFFFLANIILSLRPILPYFSSQDAISDIPLTPSQRSLLGLPPSTSTSTTSTSTFITPPRYRRRLSASSSSLSSQDTTPTTDRRSISANYSSSPLSTSRYTLGFSPAPSISQTQPRRTTSGSPFSPNASQQSPLFHKAIDRRVARRESGDLLDNGIGRSSFGTNGSPLGRSIGLGRSQSVKERGRDAFGESGNGGGRSSAAGSPAVGKRGVNYKWLYDKGVGLSGSRGSGGLVKSESMAF